MNTTGKPFWRDSVDGIDTPVTTRSGCDPLPDEVGLNVAVTPMAPFTVTRHVPVPLQPPPLHPAKREPAAGLADSVTWVPAV